MNLLLIISLLCPTSKQVEGHEVFELLLGCEMPLPRAWAITPAAFRRNSARIKGLDTKLAGKISRLAECRSDRDRIRGELIAAAKSTRTSIDSITGHLEQDLEQPSRVVWAGIGAASALVAVVAGALFYAEMR